MIGDKYTKFNAISGGGSVGATLMKTGQITSYRTGDDGDLEAGRDVDFFTLASNNPFGNTNRFTGVTGGYQSGASYFTFNGTSTVRGTAFPDNICIDWSTFNGSTVLGWDMTQRFLNLTWAVAIDNTLALSIGTYTTGWRLPNLTEMQSRLNYSVATVTNYAPFNYSTVVNLWTATTLLSNTANAYVLGNNGNGNLVGFGKTNVSYAFACRTFTVTGTTLT